MSSRSTKYMLMSLHVTLTGECLFTSSTVKWMLPAVYDSMKLQITLPIKRLTTHITVIQTLSTM